MQVLLLIDEEWRMRCDAVTAKKLVSCYESLVDELSEEINNYEYQNGPRLTGLLLERLSDLIKYCINKINAGSEIWDVEKLEAVLVNIMVGFLPFTTCLTVVLRTSLKTCLITCTNI